MKRSMERRWTKRNGGGGFDMKIDITSRERTVIKNLLEQKIRKFEGEIIEIEKRNRLEQPQKDVVGILARKDFIRKYRELINKLYQE